MCFKFWKFWNGINSIQSHVRILRSSIGPSGIAEISVLILVFFVEKPSILHSNSNQRSCPVRMKSQSFFLVVESVKSRVYNLHSKNWKVYQISHFHGPSIKKLHNQCCEPFCLSLWLLFPCPFPPPQNPCVRATAPWTRSSCCRNPRTLRPAPRGPPRWPTMARHAPAHRQGTRVPSSTKVGKIVGLVDDLRTLSPSSLCRPSPPQKKTPQTVSPAFLLFLGILPSNPSQPKNVSHPKEKTPWTSSRPIQAYKPLVVFSHLCSPILHTRHSVTMLHPHSVILTSRSKKKAKPGFATKPTTTITIDPTHLYHLPLPSVRLQTQPICLFDFVCL